MQLKTLLPLVVFLHTSQLSASPTSNHQNIIGDASFTNPHQNAFGDDDKAFVAIRNALIEAHIIDEVVDDFLPKCYVAPYYPKNGKAVTLGNTIKPRKTKDRPSLKVYCPDRQETTGLTIVLTDPDAPSKQNPKWGEMCHWIALTSGLSPDSVLEFGEEEKDIVQCYIFLLLEGVNTNLTAPAERRNWGTGKKGHGVRDWADQEELHIVGANFFYAKNKKQ